MNIYLFELRAQLKSFAIWTVSILFFYIVFMTGMYPVFSASMDSVLDVYNGFPSGFAAAFGINIEDIFSYNGFYGFVFTYIALVGAIMAVSLSVSAFAREKRSKCADFLLTKPRGRGTIYFAKLLSTLTLVLVANVLFIAASIVLYRGSNQDSSQLGRFVLAACSLFFTQLAFLAVGVFFAIYAKKVRSVSGIATAFGFAGFILSALYGIINDEKLRFVAPLKYFDPAYVFQSGGYETKYVLTAIVVMVFCFVSSYLKFCKSDAHAV